MRPQDIVGALANESNLSGRDIGAIQIHERHALVEIPEHAADEVLRSLRGSTTLKGRRANVRRDRGLAGSGAAPAPVPAARPRLTRTLDSRKAAVDHRPRPSARTRRTAARPLLSLPWRWSSPDRVSG